MHKLITQHINIVTKKIITEHEVDKKNKYKHTQKREEKRYQISSFITFLEEW